MRLAYWNFVELRVFTLGITNSFTAGEKRSIVTYNRSTTPGKLERRPFYLYHSIDVIAYAPSVLTAAFSGV